MNRNPLSPWVFLVRNPGRSVPMMLVITLSVLLIAGIVAIMNSIPLSVKKVYGYSRHLTGLTPRGDALLVPKLMEQMKAAPVPIEREVVCRTQIFNVNTIVGPWPFVMHGLQPGDMEYVASKLKLGNLVGRLAESGKGEAVITRPLASNLNLNIGDTILSPDDDKNYSRVETRVVGIYETAEWFAFTSYEFLSLTVFPPIDVVLYFTADEGMQRKLDAWAEEKFKGTPANVYTYGHVEEESAASLRILFRILNLVIALLVIVIAIMMIMMVNLFFAQRVTEFGLLQALGFSKSRLVRRALAESWIVVATGWVCGVALSLLLLLSVRAVVMAPRGFYIDPFDLHAYIYTLPVPIVVMAASTLTIYARFRKFDPIAVVERRIV